MINEYIVFKSPVKIGDYARVDSYAKGLVKGEEHLLVTRDCKFYLTDGKGGYLEFKSINSGITMDEVNQKLLDLQNSLTTEFTDYDNSLHQDITNLSNSTNSKIILLQDAVDALQLEFNDYVTVTQFNAMVAAQTHANRDVLDLFSKDANNNPLYNGKKIVADFDTSGIEAEIANLNNRSIIGSQLDYIYCKLATDSVFNAGQNIPFVKSVGNNLDINNGIVTLQKGKTYSLKFSLHEGSGAWKFFYDITNNKEIGARGDSIYNTTATAVVVCDKDIQITTRVDRATTSSAVAPGAFLEIIEIGRTIVLDPAQQIDKTTGIQDTPVGHIMSVMGVNAPTHYLACDGKTYNILSYQKLANYFLTEFGKINYFGGDGVTTFAVPDMREVVQVGTGQNATQPIISHDVYTAGQFKDDQMQKITGTYNGILKTDGSATGAIVKANTGGYAWSSGGSGSSGGGFTLDSSLVTRNDATNTTHGKQMGVLYCIKFEPTYFMNYSPQYAGFDTTVLFSGTANAISQYALLDDISNYKYLIIYASLNNGIVKESRIVNVQSTDNIVNAESVATFLNTSGFYYIYFHVINKTITIDNINTGTGWITDYGKAKIYKIEGIKSGAAPGSDFTITDAEADTTIAQVWNEVNA